MHNLTSGELARAIWRRRWWFLPPVFLALAAAAALIYWLPPTYEASTLVMVERQKVPSDYVKATITTSMDDRIRTLEPQVNNRETLERMIRQLDLFPRVRRQSGMGAAVALARKDLRLRTQGDILFSIFFEYTDPIKAAAAANQIADVFIQENLKLRENQAEGTSSFLEAELYQTRQRLEAQEAKIAAFKQRYMGQLPEQSDTSLKVVDSLQSKLQINMEAIDKAEQRRLEVQAQMQQAKTADRDRDRPAAAAAVHTPASRLEQARSELAALLTQYTERHPEVIRKRAEIASLEKEQLSAQAAAQAAALAPAPPAAPVASRQDDPVLRAEVQGIDMEVRSLKSERDHILAQISQLQARLENVPQVEQQLLSLSRDYDNIQKSYDSLLAKRIDARLAENLEKSRQGEQFKILERAVPPPVPTGPNLALILGACLLVGVGLGTLLAVLRERLDQTYVDGDSLQAAFPGVPVLAVIPTLAKSDRAAPAPPPARSVSIVGGRR
jgi:polysaccharide chain length determinant protein (PEP-CTERM system associated)